MVKNHHRPAPKHFFFSLVGDVHRDERDAMVKVFDGDIIRKRMDALELSLCFLVSCVSKQEILIWSAGLKEKKRE
jgi:hypothetical protein